MSAFHYSSIALASLLAAGSVSAGNVFQDPNPYNAPRAPLAPVVDGVADTVWNAAKWAPIGINYLGKQAISPTDFSGRYKALWDTGHLYLLVEVVDDSLSDTHPDPLDNYWNDDAVEIFLDENHDGGDHQANYSAWAYHVSTRFDAVDIGIDGKAHLYNDHIKGARIQTGPHTWLWEMSLLVHGADFVLGGTNTPLKLSNGKSMGIVVAYCDNDGGSARKNFVGSANNAGMTSNQGYMNADFFGTLNLVADTSSTGVRGRSREPVRAPGSVDLRVLPQGLRGAMVPDMRAIRIDGRTFGAMD